MKIDMYRMKKQLALITLLALLAGMFALAGCGNRANTPPEEDMLEVAPEEDEETDVTPLKWDVSTAAPSEGMTSQDVIVYDFNAVEQGADPTGEKDSTEAIQICLDLLRDIGGIVFLPAGQYKVEGTLDIPSAVTLRGEWLSPDEGGLGKGTILMAYKGKGQADPKEDAFIRLAGASCLRDISVWYPEQDPADIQPYPATIYGDGHTSVLNVTLYNSYTGFYNPGCSSMMIRGLYGTVLNMGIYGADAYDIPRIERVRFDTAYWQNSGLPGAPDQTTEPDLVAYTRENLIGIKAGQMDWGYWYDLQMNNVKYGILLVHGNDAIGKIKITNADVGIYIDNMSYPGLEVSYADIEASTAGIYYDVIGSDDEAAKDSYFDRASLVVSASTFRGEGIGIYTADVTDYGVNLNDCVFENFGESAVKMNGGHLVCANGAFNTEKAAFDLGSKVDQVILAGNTFAQPENIVSGDRRSNDDPRIQRDDDNRNVPHTPAYEHDFIPNNKPTADSLFNVMSEEYGAVKGTPQNIPEEDSTAAIQKALDDAGKAGGGTVYLPGGVYRINGSLSVPEGVELRGSFDGPHYGNSTWAGIQLYAYGDKDNADGAPLITLAEGSGVRGFTVFYPEQGYSDRALIDEEMAHAYPPTIRANKSTWIQNIAIVGGYTAIDAMTNRCDGIVIYDVTGAAMSSTLLLGHGTDGGVVQNLHFNYSGWGQQGQYANNPDYAFITANGTTNRSDLMTEYTSRIVKGMVLGDCKNIDFFSCFNIIINTQIQLIKDPYTGGSFEGTMWGVAFDAAQHGVVAEDDCDAELTLINSMGVFNQQGGGYNFVTKPGFTGTISTFNQDVWDDHSKIAYIEGGTVDLVQYFSWCCYDAECFEGGTLNILGSTIISAYGDGNGKRADVTYHPSANGKVIATLDCDERLNITVEPEAIVEKALNGTEYKDLSVLIIALCASAAILVIISLATAIHFIRKHKKSKIG